MKEALSRDEQASLRGEQKKKVKRKVGPSPMAKTNILLGIPMERVGSGELAEWCTEGEKESNGTESEKIESSDRQNTKEPVDRFSVTSTVNSFMSPDEQVAKSKAFSITSTLNEYCRTDSIFKA